MNKNFIHEIEPEFGLVNMWDNYDVDLVKTLILENSKDNYRLLQEHGMKPRNRILIEGKSGCGCTMLAHVIATELRMPIFQVRYENVMLYEDSAKTVDCIRKVFEFAKVGDCVLLFDDFEDVNYHEDFHRCFRQQVAKMPDWIGESNTVMIVVNHLHKLDNQLKAMHDVHLYCHAPDANNRAAFIENFFEKNSIGNKHGFKYTEIAETVNVKSFSELEKFCTDVYRSYIIRKINGVDDLDAAINLQMESWAIQRRFHCPAIDKDEDDA